MDANQTDGEKAWRQLHKNAGSPWGNNPQSSNCTATNHPSRKLSKLDEAGMQDTTGEVGTSSSVMYSYGPLHMDEQKQYDQLEPTYSSSVLIRDVALETCRKHWMIGRDGERRSGIFVLMVWQDDDDDLSINSAIQNFQIST